MATCAVCLDKNLEWVPDPDNKGKWMLVNKYDKSKHPDIQEHKQFKNHDKQYKEVSSE
jgi:hypothetical protein